MNDAARYVPKPTGVHREFYERSVSGGLHLQICNQCRTWQHPPRHYCRSCRSADLSFEPARSTGTIYSVVVSHFTHDPGWRDDTPFATVLVATPEGPRVVAWWRGPVDEAAIGIPVRLDLDVVNESFGRLQAWPASP